MLLCRNYYDYNCRITLEKFYMSMTLRMNVFKQTKNIKSYNKSSEKYEKQVHNVKRVYLLELPKCLNSC